MRQARLLIGGIVVALVATAAAMGSPTEPRRAARIAAVQAGCGSLGAAADFTVFSDGVFDASKGSGTSVSGRIAAAGDVTLDAISVGPAPGDGPPTVVTGANFHGGRPGGSGGTLNGGVRARGAIDQAPNFTINGTQEPHTAPGFSFADEFAALAALSDLWGSQPATPGATAALNIYSHALELHGPADGLNVFHVGAADLAAAAGIVITLDKPGATALIDVSTDTVLTVSAQYLNLSANVSADRLVWNLPLASGLNVTHGIAFKGLILAPHATVTSAGHPQLDGQLIAADVPGSEWVLRRAAFSGCLPAPTPPDTTLTLGPRCIDGAGNLTMRLRNTGDHARDVRWDDLNGPQFGAFRIPAGNDYFFHVPDGDAGSLIRVVADGGTTVESPGSSARCKGRITVAKVTQGAAPAGAVWAIRVTDGEHGSFDQTARLAAGASQVLDVPGGYQPGAAPIGQVVGGILYTITEPDPLGGTATISHGSIQIIDGQDERVTVTNTFADDTGDGTGPPVPPPVDPVQPPLPPGAPDPLPGPDLVGAGDRLAADLVVTHSVRPGRLRAGGIVRSVTTVRNAGALSAVGTVARELPQYRAANANSVATILSVSTSVGTCTSRRPLRCELGRIAPGAAVTIRTTARVLVAASLQSTVYASSETPESNTTNNTAVARVRSVRPSPALSVRVRAAPVGRVGRPTSYRVSVTGGAPAGASEVRLCSRPSALLTQVRAPGTFTYRGARCRDIGVLRRGRTASFRVWGVPARRGRLPAPATATAVGLRGVRRALDHTLVVGPAGCAAAVRFC